MKRVDDVTDLHQNIFWYLQPLLEHINEQAADVFSWNMEQVFVTLKQALLINDIVIVHFFCHEGFSIKETMTVNENNQLL